MGIVHLGKAEDGGPPPRQAEKPIVDLASSASAAALNGVGDDVRLKTVIRLFAASLIACLPMQAAAQDQDGESVAVRDRPRPEYDPLGMRLGGFDLAASLTLSATSTDNLYFEETGGEDDIIFRISPYARLASHWSRHALAFEGGYTNSSHQDFSTEDADTYFLRTNGRLDIGRSSSLAAGAGFAQLVESRADPDSALTPGPVEYERTDAYVTATHRFNRFRVSGTARRDEYDFEGSQNFRDNESDALIGRVDAELTPRLGALFQVQVDDRSYANAPAFDSEGLIYLTGLSVNITDLMRGELLVGQFERDYDSGESTDGVAVSGNLEWNVTRLTTLNFDVNRNSETVIGANAAPYTQTSYGVRVDHEFRRNVLLFGSLRAGDAEFAGVDRNDDFTSAEAGVEYIVNRHVSLRGSVARLELQSDGVDRYRDYEVNELRGAVTFRL